MMTGATRVGSATRRSRRVRSRRPALESLEGRLVLSGPGDGMPVVTYSIVQDWGTGQQGQIAITNDEATAFRGWTLAFDYPRSVQDIWNAFVVSHTSNHYAVRDAGYNATIDPGKTITIGFTAGSGQATDRATS